MCVKIFTCGWQSDEIYRIRFIDSGEDEVAQLLQYGCMAAGAMRGTPTASVKRMGLTCQIELLFGLLATQACYTTTESIYLADEIDNEFRKRLISVSGGTFQPKADSP